MKNFLMVCALSAMVGNVWASPAPEAVYRVNGTDYNTDAVVSESLFHGSTTGLPDDSFNVITEMIRQAKNNNYTGDVEKLTATLNSFGERNAAGIRPWSVVKYRSKTLPALEQYGFSFDKDFIQAGRAFPSRNLRELGNKISQ